MNDTPIKILAIDDDARLQDALRDFFTSGGYALSSLSCGKGVEEALERIKPDIVLLDVMMPGEDGFSVIHTIRSISYVPVIMLTARGDEADCIRGLESGADDYLPKPFNPRELIARIKAVLRRTAQAAPAGDTAAGPLPDELHCGELVLNFRRHTLTAPGGTASLSATETYILGSFMRYPNAVLSREQLLTLAFNGEHCSTERTIDVHISHLRGMLRSVGEPHDRIKTVWSRGYSWLSEI